LQSLVEVDYLIASGILIRVSVLDKVGLMRSDFFIDYIDIEWGLRAKHFGFDSFGVCAAHMEHQLGDAPIHWFGRKIPMHSPLRHYYHVRNAILMYFDRRFPLNWKIVDGQRLVLKFGFYSLFGRPRLEHFKKMSKGIYHGISRRGGEFL
jgi:rhamnosyltransferase